MTQLEKCPNGGEHRWHKPYVNEDTLKCAMCDKIKDEPIGLCEDCGKTYTNDPHTCKNKLFDALNRLDAFASMATQDNDNGEAEEQAKDYNTLFDFIKTLGQQKIIVPMSSSDCDDVLAGESFDWVFADQNGNDIKVHIERENAD